MIHVLLLLLLMLGKRRVCAAAPVNARRNFAAPARLVIQSGAFPGAIMYCGLLLEVSQMPLHVAKLVSCPSIPEVEDL